MKKITEKITEKIESFENLATAVRKHGYFSTRLEALLEGHDLMDAAYEIHRANRHYVADNLDPSTEGNYLHNFLAQHGNEPAHRFIKYFGGNAHSAGQGLVVFTPDYKKVRQRIENFLCTAGDYKTEEIARKLGINLYTDD